MYAKLCKGITADRSLVLIFFAYFIIQVGNPPLRMFLAKEDFFYLHSCHSLFFIPPLLRKPPFRLLYKSPRAYAAWWF